MNQPFKVMNLGPLAQPSYTAGRVRGLQRQLVTPNGPYSTGSTVHTRYHIHGGCARPVPRRMQAHPGRFNETRTNVASRLRSAISYPSPYGIALLEARTSLASRLRSWYSLLHMQLPALPIHLFALRVAHLIYLFQGQP